MNIFKIKYICLYLSVLSALLIYPEPGYSQICDDDNIYYDNYNENRKADSLYYKYDVDSRAFPVFMPREDDLEKYPGLYDGIVQDIRCMRVKQSPIIDKVLSLVDSTDVSAIFPELNFFKIKSYLLKVSERKANADAPWSDFELKNLPNKVDLKGNEDLTITLTEMNLMNPEAKYCFPCGNHLIFTAQWIDGLFDYEEARVGMFLDEPEEGEAAVVWRFIFRDNAAEKQMVYLIGIVNDTIWAYDFMTKKYFREK